MHGNGPRRARYCVPLPGFQEKARNSVPYGTGNSGRANHAIPVP